MILLYVVAFRMQGMLINETLYQKWHHFCPLVTNIYYRSSSLRKPECAVICAKRRSEKCNRWIWDPDQNECHIHSDSVSLYSLTTTNITSYEVYTELKHVSRVSACTESYNYDMETNTCFRVVLERTSWKTARQRCHEENADLISLPNKQKWDLVISNIKCNIGPFWIGLKGQVWLTGENFTHIYGDEVLPGLNNYDTGFSDVDAECDCANVRKRPWYGDPSLIYIWDESCHYRERFYICEITMP